MSSEAPAVADGTDAIAAASVVAVGVVVGLAPWAASCLRHAGSKAVPHSIPDFFLASQTVPWPLAGLAIFATTASPDVVQGWGQLGIRYGLPSALPPLLCFLGMLTALFLVLPIVLRSGVTTVVEYASARFSSPVLRAYLAVVLLTAVLLPRLVVVTFFTTQLVEHALGWPAYPTVPLTTLLACLVPLCGGLSAVVRMQGVFAVVLAFSAAVVVPLAFTAMGGWASMTAATQHSSEAVNAGFHPWMLHLFRSQGPYESIGGVFGGALTVAWLYAFDPSVMQFTVAARSKREAKSGIVLAAFLALLLPFAFAIPGVVSRLLFPSQLACRPDGPCLNSANVLALTLYKWLPHGLWGVALGAMASTLLSSVSSLLMATSTIFTVDVLQLTARASPTVAVWAGRAWLVTVSLATMLWVVAGAVVPSIVVSAFQAVPLFVGGPIAAVLVVGAVWPRLTAAGAMSGLAAAHTLAVLRVVWQSAAAASAHPPALLVPSVLQFGTVVALLAVVVAVVVSSCTTPVAPDFAAQYLSKSALRLCAAWFPRYRTAASMIHMHDARDPAGAAPSMADAAMGRVDVEMAKFTLVATAGSDDDDDFADAGSGSDGRGAPSPASDDDRYHRRARASPAVHDLGDGGDADPWAHHAEVKGNRPPPGADMDVPVKRRSRGRGRHPSAATRRAPDVDHDAVDAAERAHRLRRLVTGCIGVMVVVYASVIVYFA